MNAIFIDRDGVINKDPGGWTKYEYVTEWKDFHFLPGALVALKKIKDMDLRVIVISNQAGVGKGYFSESRLKEITDNMIREVEKNGGAIEGAYYCIHTKEDKCSCRKPSPGMLELAAKKYEVDLKNTYFIGDTEADCLAGKKAGCRTVLVLSGKTSKKEIEGWNDKPNHIFSDLLEFAKWLEAEIAKKD